LCVGLANAAYLENELPIHGQEQGVVICPGPNPCYFDREFSLAEMVGHIYGTIDLLAHIKRPSVLINELKMYVDYLVKEIETRAMPPTCKSRNGKITSETCAGIDYYQELLPNVSYFGDM
jgi:hypothetical protein